MDGLVIDNFAGGGGASTGIAMAIGRDPDIAINHSPQAVAMHKANHPATRHLIEDVWAVDPAVECAGRPVDLAWFSPDCTHFSRAKGGKPRSKKTRSLAWVVVRWAKAVRPAVIMLENVEEFLTWGPVDNNGDPCRRRAGRTFKMWVGKLRGLGYDVQWRSLVAADFGAPTTRKRLFLIARCDGEKIVWPTPTHGRHRAHPWRAAAEVIDFSLPCPSIFARKKALAEATLRRIGAGLRRYVLESPRPFVIHLTHQGERATHTVDKPLPTVTGANRGELALVTPFVSTQFGQSVGRAATDPLPTVTGGGMGHQALVVPYLMTNTTGHPGRPVDAPVPTITTGDHHYLVTPFIAPAKTWGGGGNDPRSAEEPMRTITASKRGEFVLVAPTLVQTGYGEREGQAPRAPGLHKPLGTVVPGGKHGLVAAFLAKHYGGPNGHATPGQPMTTPAGAITAQDHHALVTTQLELPGTRPDAAAAFVTKFYGTSTGADAAEPLPTVTANGRGGGHLAEVRAFLVKYYGSDGSAQSQQQSLFDPLHTVTSKARFGLVTIEGAEYEITDIGMRMLAPKELFTAQSFPPDYRLDVDFSDPRSGRQRKLTKTELIDLCGNSVCAVLACALVRANLRRESATNDDGREAFTGAA